ncbi:MAG: Coenzyme F420 hydrogenase/dehydrogenase, beta subunit C-terminal domain [Planctomycetes bacterium]|nr:Coenzyme F420 hydrogenase/dehydrogenase, beta subunit C-terminal domain [Planctomycetota bacterium]
MNLPVVSISEVVSRHMCTGCGACAFMCPDKVQMIDTATHGRRPELVDGPADPRDASLEQAALVCPGVNYPAMPAPAAGVEPELFDEWGPVLEVWEGYSTDSEIRFRGSSGGVVTGLALFCVEQGGMAGALHVRARQDAPLLNETVLSRDRESLLAGSGSRYSPASPCEELGQIENAEGPCVFIGKPCDIAAAAKARAVRPELDRKLGLTIGIFCAGTPSLQGTIALAKRLGADDPSQIEDIRYRGHGWPGEITATWRNPKTGLLRTSSVTYADGWGNTLQKYRQWRCHMCADHTGETADVSVGDPWYRPVQPGEPGRSLVLVRTERGRQIVREAVAKGYLVLERRAAHILVDSQKHLERTRATIWGRSVASRLLGVLTPQYKGMKLFKAWAKRLSWKERLQSLTGTVTRVFRRHLLRPERSVPAQIGNFSRDSEDQAERPVACSAGG